jgi:hypothetical protein
MPKLAPRRRFLRYGLVGIAAVTHAAALAGIPVRVASGFDDPFYPGVRVLARALPKNPGGAPPEVAFAKGCHTSPFFNVQEPPSLAFLARYLT